MQHIYGAQMKQSTHQADLKTRPPLTNPDVHYFVTDGDFIEDKPFNNFHANSHH
jgi:hypothetical protein